MSLSILKTVVESFGAIVRIAADDRRPATVSVVHVVFENGNLTVEAVPEDDTLKLSVGTEAGAHSQEISGISPWNVLVEGNPLWFWILNHQGYTDGLQLLFQKDGHDIGFQIVVMATSLKPYLVIEQ